MKKIKIDLGMLVRVHKPVTVLVPDDFDTWNEADKECLMSVVYDRDEGDGFVNDPESMPRRRSHRIIGFDNTEDKLNFLAMSPNYIRVLNVCDYCKKHSAFVGIHLPSNFDDREPSRDGKVFVAQCDACGIYGSDSEAAAAVAKETGWMVENSYDRDDSLEERSGDDWRPYFKVDLDEVALLKKPLASVTSTKSVEKS